MYQHLQFRVDSSARRYTSQGDGFHLRTNQNQRNILPARPELEGVGMCIKFVNRDYYFQGNPEPALGLARAAVEELEHYKQVALWDTPFWLALLKRSRIRLRPAFMPCRLGDAGFGGRLRAVVWEARLDG